MTRALRARSVAVSSRSHHADLAGRRNASRAQRLDDVADQRALRRPAGSAQCRCRPRARRRDTTVMPSRPSRTPPRPRTPLPPASDRSASGSSKRCSIQRQRSRFVAQTCTSESASGKPSRADAERSRARGSMRSRATSTSPRLRCPRHRRSPASVRVGVIIPTHHVGRVAARARAAPVCCGANRQRSAR